MKHVKLFEQFMSSGAGVNPVIIAKGDWSGILLDPTNENISRHALFIQPSTFMVDYLTNPKTGEAPDSSYFGDIYDDVETIVDEIISGDQNGHVLAPKDYATPSHPKGSQGDIDEKNGIQRMEVDSSIDPEEIRAALEEGLDTINAEVFDQESSQAEDVATDPSSPSIYTPEYIAHCKMVMSGKPGSMKRKLVFNIR
jgi:hypothetical protein